MLKMPRKKPNCWEYMRCGREPGGAGVERRGICPAASERGFEGFNQGEKAGRCCWLVAGTFCKGKIQGSFAEKQSSCRSCEFYRNIHAETAATHITTTSLKVSVRTHMGRVKRANEDRYLIKEIKDGGMLMAVADGLGGDVAGDYAAELLRGKLNGITTVPKNRETSALTEVARKIDRIIFEIQEKSPALSAGMGCTLIGVFYRGGKAFWVNVGDSRLYIMKTGMLSQITEDQTLARFLMAEGEISKSEAATHYSRNVMDQFLGCGFVEPETGSLDLIPGDQLLLASDGLHRQISAKALQSVMAARSGLEEKTETLMNTALSAGGEDNITVMLAERTP